MTTRKRPSEVKVTDSLKVAALVRPCVPDAYGKCAGCGCTWRSVIDYQLHPRPCKPSQKFSRRKAERLLERVTS